jgi:hypothetical protein
VAMLFLRGLHISSVAALIILLLGAIYVVFGPMFVSLKKRRRYEAAG